jgi:hypothetical protein
MQNMETEKSIQQMGGEARAKAYSPEERSEMSRNAALARWEKAESAKKVPKAMFGSPDRPLRIGNLEIPCYVLEDGRRVLVQTGMINSLGISPGGSGSRGGDRLAKFTHQERLKSFMDNDILSRTETPIYFRATNGVLAYGYDAEVLAKICFAILDADKAGRLQRQQEHIVKQCEILVRGFAIVGINALVDEATGYQEVRDRQALSEILKKYIDGELYKWTETFPIALYKEIFRLKGWPWNNGKMPQVVGHYTNDLIYDRLTKGMLAELKRINPKDIETGRRKHRNYQFLTPEIGYPALNQRLYELLGMARASATWEQFYRLVDRTFPRMGDTLPLPFVEDV